MKIKAEAIGTLILWLSIGILINSIEILSIRKICHYPEHGPFFYGFPMVYRTNMTWVNSGSGIIYMSGLIVNGFFWGSFIFFLKQLLSKVLPKKAVQIFISLIVMICLINFTMTLIAYDLAYKFHHKVKMDYYQQEIECDRSLKLFNFWMDEGQIEKNQ